VNKSQFGDLHYITSLTVACILLFLVVAIDFTSKMMSILADGVLVVVVIALLWSITIIEEVGPPVGL